MQAGQFVGTEHRVEVLELRRRVQRCTVGDIEVQEAASLEHDVPVRRQKRCERPKRKCGSGQRVRDRAAVQCENAAPGKRIACIAISQLGRRVPGLPASALREVTGDTVECQDRHRHVAGDRDGRSRQDFERDRFRAETVLRHRIERAQLLVAANAVGRYGEVR